MVSGSMKILVVDDDPATREGLRHALLSQGYEVTAAASSGEAYAASAGLPLDVVIADWQLNDDDRDGVEVAAQLRQSAGARVILITARDLSDLKERASSLQVDAFLRKPFPLKRLLEVLSTF